MEKLQTKFNSFAQMLEKLSDEKDCREFLEHLRWGGKPICPHCGCQNKDHYKLKQRGEFKGLYKCKDCRERFTVRVGTMFHSSPISLRKWFIAVYIFSSHKKGISSLQLHRDLGVTQKTAWFMLQRIRNTFSVAPDKKLTGTTQVDETFVGGKNKNRHTNKKTKESQGRSTKDKTPVFGMVNNGKVNTQVVSNTRSSTLKPIIEGMVEKGSIIVTDEWLAYKGLASNYQHEILKHKSSEFVNNHGFNTNSIEGFWSLLKRGIFGIYHSTSQKHLSKYCDEFSYRYNTREFSDGERFALSLINSKQRLTYKELIN